jgi:hypothetical protein
MRSVFSAARRGAAIVIIVGLLFVPVAAVADDAEIRPPHPQSVSILDDSDIRPPQPQSVLWHTLFVILANSRLLPFVS